MRAMTSGLDRPYAAGPTDSFNALGSLRYFFAAAWISTKVTAFSAAS